MLAKYYLARAVRKLPTISWHLLLRESVDLLFFLIAFVISAVSQLVRVLLNWFLSGEISDLRSLHMTEFKNFERKRNLEDTKCK